MVLGSHICDMMRYFLGDPKWVFSHVTEDGKELGRGQGPGGNRTHRTGSRQPDRGGFQFRRRHPRLLRLQGQRSNRPKALRPLVVRQQGA